MGILKKKRLHKWIIYLIYVVAIILFIIIGWQMRGSDVQNKVDDCDEWCFHFGFKEDVHITRQAIGFYFNESCICQNGAVGWFE
jgi:hypothetical protein